MPRAGPGSPWARSPWSSSCFLLRLQGRGSKYRARAPTPYPPCVREEQDVEQRTGRRHRAQRTEDRMRAQRAEDRGQDEGTENRTWAQSTEDRTRAQRAEHRGQDAGAEHRGQDAGAEHRGQDTGAECRGQDAGVEHRGQDAGTEHRGQDMGAEHRGQDAGAEHRYRTCRAEPETPDGAPGEAGERVRAESFGTLSSGRSERVDGQLNAVAGDARLRRAPSPVWEAFPAGPSPGTLWPDPPAEAPHDPRGPGPALVRGTGCHHACLTSIHTVPHMASGLQFVVLEPGPHGVPTLPRPHEPCTDRASASQAPCRLWFFGQLCPQPAGLARPEGDRPARFPHGSPRQHQDSLTSTRLEVSPARPLGQQDPLGAGLRRWLC